MKTLTTIVLVILTLAGCWWMAAMSAFSFIGMAESASSPFMQYLLGGLGGVAFMFWTFAAGSWSMSVARR